MSEDRLTQECYLWFHRTYPQFRGLLFHVPNGGARLAREAKRFRSMGAWPGVSDFIFLWDGKAYLIELKTKKGRQSQKQLEWQARVERHGFAYWIVRSLIEFQSIVTSIMEEKYEEYKM